MTIIPLGAARCIDCKAPVAIVRRTVEVPCWNCGEQGCETYHGPRTNQNHASHTHTIPDVGPFTTVDADGTRHECAA